MNNLTPIFQHEKNMLMWRKKNGGWKINYAC